MPDHQQIYFDEAQQYERLISREDVDGNILKALINIRDMNGLQIADIGAGTGRLSCLLAPLVTSIHAFDASAQMLDVLQESMKQLGIQHCVTAVADHRNLPLPNASVDILTAGWTICYLASSNEPNWQKQLEEVLDEALRIIRPGGTMIILETLGTGHKEPSAPDFLQQYYDALENNYGFSKVWIRTDYEFSDLMEAQELTSFFFGDALLEQVKRESSARLPECTGIWWKQHV